MARAVLVTGASGYIGTELVKQLIELKDQDGKPRYEVTVLVPQQY